MTRIDLISIVDVILAVALLVESSHAQLSSTIYAASCPNVSPVMLSAIEDALNRDHRAGAKMGFDGSVLLDNADDIESEKDAKTNAVSLIGYGIVDDIKTALENVCPGVVSCPWCRSCRLSGTKKCDNHNNDIVDNHLQLRDTRNNFNLDLTTPTQFDSAYFGNLQNNIGLLSSDQVLFSTTGSDTVCCEPVCQQPEPLLR